MIRVSSPDVARAAGPERVEQRRPSRPRLLPGRGPGAHHPGADDDQVGRQRGSSSPARAPPRAQDRVPEHHVRQARRRGGVTSTRPSVGHRPALEERLADHRHRVRVAVELAGVAVGEELLALVDDEQRRVARRPRRRSRSRSRPRRRARRGRASRRSSTWRSAGGRNDAAVTTTSAPSTASRAEAATVARGDPGRRAGVLGERRRPGRGRGRRRELHARQHVAQHRHVAARLDARADERRRGSAGPAAGAHRRGSRRRGSPPSAGR